MARVLAGARPVRMLQISHVNLPAREPERLARWYETELGMERRGTFLLSAGTLLAFEAGEPIEQRGNSHFGFYADSPATVARWATHFGTALETEAGFASTKVRDPEGNWFEIYWELAGPSPPELGR